MRGQRRTDFRTGPVDQIEYARRDSGFVHHLGPDRRAEGGELQEGFNTMVQPAARAGTTFAAT